MYLRSKRAYRLVGVLVFLLLDQFLGGHVFLIFACIFYFANIWIFKLDVCRSDIEERKNNFS